MKWQSVKNKTANIEHAGLLVDNDDKSGFNIVRDKPLDFVGCWEFPQFLNATHYLPHTLASAQVFNFLKGFISDGFTRHTHFAKKSFIFTLMRRGSKSCFYSCSTYTQLMSKWVMRREKQRIKKIILWMYGWYGRTQETGRSTQLKKVR